MLTHGIQQNITLADKNWFKTGGCAQFYAQPSDANDLVACILFAQKHDLPTFILGHGANVLISDAGFKGLVIRPQLTSISLDIIEGDTALVTAGGGTSFADLISFCLEHQLVGLEEFSGIPGTVGGSIYINLHYFEFFLEPFIHSARVIEKKTGIIKTVDRDWFAFGYNQSRLQREEEYLVDAQFKLTKVNPLKAAYAQGRSAEIIRHRVKRYPTQGTCGSFFRNFFSHELVGKETPVPFVAYYLDNVGVKGRLQVGDARVSHQHANMIVNNGRATAADIINVAIRMQTLVRDTFGIIPQPECRLIGFESYPLLR